MILISSNNKYRRFKDVHRVGTTSKSGYGLRKEILAMVYKGTGPSCYGEGNPSLNSMVAPNRGHTFLRVFEK